MHYRGGWKIPVLLVTLAAGAALGAVAHRWVGEFPGALLKPHTEERVTVQSLRQEQLLFLVTDRVVTRVVVEQKEQSVLLGPRDGHLIATARLYYGVDLKEIAPEDIERGRERVTVRLPRPRLLDFGVDPDMEFISERSGLQVIRDWFTGEDLEHELQRRVRDQAMSFAERHELLPDPDTMLARLNRFGNGLLPGVQREVRFQFREKGTKGQRDEGTKGEEEGQRH